MSAEHFLNGRVILHCGNCLDVLKTLAPDSVDSVCTDPPYHLTSIVKRFGNEQPRSNMHDKDRGDIKALQYKRLAGGFMGKQWDGGDIAFRSETWAEVLRVMKPGAHLIACGGTRTYHRLACAIEDAGFEIRDCIQWIYGSGFPKSHSVSVAVDKMNGVAPRSKAFNMKGRGERADELDSNGREFLPPYEPATDAAREWSGFGTALKPAVEMIVLARRPLSQGTVAANVLRWGTGALNIDGCRVGVEEMAVTKSNGEVISENIAMAGPNYGRIDAGTKTGRWPANVIHDGSDEVVAAFPESGAAKSGGVAGWQKDGYVGGKYEPIERTGYDDNGGSAARFFYTAKADSDDRLGSRHPTVKPLDLMQYLVRLITPPKGTVLDLFAGTGTTGEAAYREGMSAILIERELEYINDIRRRMALVMAGPDERNRESIKAKNLPRDDGPLFAFREAAE